jgi:putative addiction module component (TIGR02574 family)
MGGTPLATAATGASPMRKITASDAMTLSLSERIQLVGDIWDSIATELENQPINEAERRILDERLDAYQRNPEEGTPWEEVRRNLEAL